MNQTCKVCGEPAAGFHFGAFTCEGCKSFFGRSYNNLSSISECKNNGECIINKKNRTACKACRLRKCLMVGMSKSGSRYGRRSNWFKIHCLLQEQQQQASSQPILKPMQKPPHQHHQPPPPPINMQFNPFMHHLNKTKEELILLGLDDYKAQVSPSVSSPESHNSDSSVEVSDRRLPPLFHSLLAPAFPLPIFPPGYPVFLPPAPPHNNNNVLKTTPVDAFNKRVFLDAVLQSQRRTPTPPDVEVEEEQEDPIDLSVPRGGASEKGGSDVEEDEAEESGCDEDGAGEVKRIRLQVRPEALDLTTKV